MLYRRAMSVSMSTAMDQLDIFANPPYGRRLLRRTSQKAAGTGPCQWKELAAKEVCRVPCVTGFVCHQSQVIFLMPVCGVFYLV